jgi:hypothetical protein
LKVATVSTGFLEPTRRGDSDENDAAIVLR